MVRNICVILTTLAVLTTTGIAIEDYGVEGEDYAVGEVIFKVNKGVYFGEREGVTGGNIETGYKGIDDVFDYLGVNKLEQVNVLPDEPIDHPNGRWTWEDLLASYEKRGLGKWYYIEYTESEYVPDAIDRLLSTGDIEKGHPNWYYEHCETIPDDKYYPDQWYLQDDLPGGIACNVAWDYETGDPSIGIAILDSGISMPHPEFSGVYYSGYSGKIFAAWDTNGHDDNGGVAHDRPLDYDGHGTACAGIAAAMANNRSDLIPGIQIKATGIAGTSWGSRIMPVKVTYIDRSDPYDPSPCWTTKELYLARGVWHAMYCGGDIISMSFGGTGDMYGSNFHENIISAFDDFGCLLFAAAGNNNANSIHFPAAYAKVIAVGAIDKSAERAYFSNYGGELELCAPGLTIYTTDGPEEDPVWPHPRVYDIDPEDDLPGAFKYYDEYNSGFTGTSASTPLAAGVAALLWSKRPDFDNQTIRSWITRTARDLGPIGRDDYYGWGCVDPAKALGIPPMGVSGNGESLTADKKVSSALTAEEAGEYNELTIYPNPASGFCNIGLPYTGASEVFIYDIKGRLVYEKTTTTNHLAWDLNDLSGNRVSSGIYIVHINNENAETVKKVMVR